MFAIGCGFSLVSDNDDFVVVVVKRFVPFGALQDEDHRYYKSRVIVGASNETLSYWVNEETMYKAETHGTLSESYRSAVVSWWRQ